MFGLLASLTLSAAHAADKNYTSIRLEGPEAGRLCPGEFIEIKLYGTDASGKESRIKGSAVDDYPHSWDIMPVGKSLGIYMPKDPRAGWGKVGTYAVSSSKNPDLNATVNVPMRYDCPVSVAYYGPAGTNGSYGAAGSSDRIGGPGGYAGPGGLGPVVEVSVNAAKEPASGVLVRRIAVKNPATGAVTWYAADADTGVTVASVGGSGGVGGHGGSPYGSGGEGGSGGPGGLVKVTVDATATKHLENMAFASPGGAGGPGGSPGEGGAAGPAGPAGPSGGAAQKIPGKVGEWPEMPPEALAADEEGLTKADRHVRNKGTMTIVGGSLLGVGAAVALGDVGYVLVAQSANQATYDKMVEDAKKLPAGSVKRFQAEADADTYKYDNVDSLSPINLVSEAGVVVAVVGGVFMYLGLKDADFEAHPIVVPVPGGSMLGLTGAF